MTTAQQWIAGHKQEALAGGGAVVVTALALISRHKKTAAAATAAATAIPAPIASSGGIGVPSTTLSDIQSAVQDQINAEIGHIPAGPTGPAGPAGPGGPRGPGPVAPPAPKPIPKPRILGMYEVNANRIHHKLHSISLAQYRAQYPGGLEQNAAQTLYMTQLDNNLGVHPAAVKARPTIAVATPAAMAAPRIPLAAPRPRAAAAVPQRALLALPGVNTQVANKYGRLTGQA